MMRSFFCVRNRTRLRAAPACARRIGIATAFLTAAGLALLAPEAKAQTDIHDSLVVHLPFDGDVMDHTGRGNNGTILNAGANPPSPYVPGIIGQAYQTQGQFVSIDVSTSSYILLGSPPDLQFGAGTPTDFSVSFWGQYVTSGQNDDIPWISNKDWNSGGNRGWGIFSQSGGGVKWNFRSMGEVRADSNHLGLASGGGLDDGNWHHFVVVFGPATNGLITTYLDGVDVDDTSSGSALDVAFVFPTNILQDGTGSYTDQAGGANWNMCAIDDLGIWRRALTADEITLIYTMGLQGISALD